MTKGTLPGWLTASETARQLDKDRSTIYEWMDKGHLPFEVKAGRRMIPESAVLKILETATEGE